MNKGATALNLLANTLILLVHRLAVL